MCTHVSRHSNGRGHRRRCCCCCCCCCCCRRRRHRRHVARPANGKGRRRKRVASHHGISRLCFSRRGGGKRKRGGDECRRCRHRATVYCTIAVAFAAHGHRLRQKEGARERETELGDGRRAGGGKKGEGKRGERWSNAGTRATHGRRSRKERDERRSAREEAGGQGGREREKQEERKGERERKRDGWMRPSANSWCIEVPLARESAETESQRWSVLVATRDRP